MKKEKQEPTLEVVSKKTEMEARRAHLQKMVDRLTEKIEKTEKELLEKLYVIEGKQESADSIIDFLKHRAQWKFTESLGVLECIKQIQDGEKKLKAGKVKELMVPSLALEAIYYFITKIEGKGYAEAHDFVNSLLKPVSDALGRSKNDRAALDQLVRDRGTLESSIDSGATIENEDRFVKEIEEELSKEL
jgi:hypothetical protein